MREMLLAASKSYYVGLINKHIANVEIYLSKSVGIGEHSDILASIDKEIAEILELPPIKLHCSVLAEDCIRQAVEHWEEKSAHRKHNELGGHA